MNNDPRLECMTYERNPRNEYSVYCNGTFLGMIYERDGLWVFWPIKTGNGWPEFLLRCIADKLSELNAGPEPKSEVIKPAIRRIDLED